MYCIMIPSVKRSLLLQCTFVALACCILVPGPCSGDDGKEEALPSLQEGDNKSDGHDVLTNSIGMKLKLIKPGSFMMGADSDADNETPVHKVTLTKPFYIGVCEVTQQ